MIFLRFFCASLRMLKSFDEFREYLKGKFSIGKKCGRTFSHFFWNRKGVKI